MKKMHKDKYVQTEREKSLQKSKFTQMNNDEINLSGLKTFDNKYI